MNHQILQNKKGGYIALISTVIISAVLVGSAFTVARSGFFSRFDSLNSEYKRISKGMAESCINEALLEIAKNQNASGTGSGLSVDCQYSINNSESYDPVTHQKTVNIVSTAEYPAKNGAFSKMEINSTIYNPQYSPPSKIVVNAYSYGEGAKSADLFAPFTIENTVTGETKTAGQAEIKIRDSGIYRITETDDPDDNYTTVYSGDCADHGGYGTLDLGVNDYKTCNIINTLKPQTASLTVIIYSTDGTMPAQLNFNGTINNNPQSSQKIPPISITGSGVNTFSISVSAITGYNVSDWAGSADSDGNSLCYGDFNDGTVKLKKGDNIVCAIAFKKQVPPPDTVMMLDRTGSMFNEPEWIPDEIKAAKSLLGLFGGFNPNPYVGVGVFANDSNVSAKIAGYLTNNYGSETLTATSTESKLAQKSGTNGSHGSPGGQNQWTDPDNGRNIDTTFTTDSTLGDQQDYSNFGFSIPSGTTITGVEVIANGKVSAGAINTEQLTPNGIGNYNNWTANDSSNKVTDVSANDGDSTYISESTSGDAQTFTVTNANVPSGSIVNSVTLYAMARRSNNSPSIKLRIERGTDSGNQNDGNTISLTGSYTLYSRQMTTNPLTGLAWTATEVNNWTTRFGVIKSNTFGTARVTQIYVAVNYTPPTATGQIAISLSSDNGNNWTNQKTINLTSIEASSTPVGNSSLDTWDRTWSTSDFINGSARDGTGFALRVQNNSYSGMVVSLNYITVKVNYEFISDSTGLYLAINDGFASSYDGWTDLSAAINEGNKELNSSRHIAGHNKFLILVSDGKPTLPNTGRNSTALNQEAALDKADFAKTDKGAANDYVTEIYTIHFGDATGRDFLSHLANGTTTVPGHENGSENGAGTSNDSTLIYNENHDGDHFYISPTSEEMAGIFQIIGEEILAPSVNELPPTLVVITQVNNISGTANKTANQFKLDLYNPADSTTSQELTGLENGELRTLTTGSYNVAPRSDPDKQYTVSASPDCSGTIAAAETKTCVIIYTANSPSPPPIEMQQNIDINSWEEKP